MDEYRAACPREHIDLANLLAIQSWIRGPDCIVLIRKHLAVFCASSASKESASTG